MSAQPPQAQPPHPAQARPAATIPEAPAGAPAPAPRAGKPQKRRRSWPFIVGGVLLVLIAGVAIASQPLLSYFAREHAAKNGIVLTELEDVDLGWGTITLEGFRFRFDEVEGIEGSGKALTVTLDGTRPKKLAGEELELELTGSAAVLAVAISEWAGDHPELVRIPSDVKDVDVSWRESEGGPVWLRIVGGSIQPSKKGARLAADGTEVLGLSTGAAAAVWNGDEATVRLGVGTDDLDDAPVRIVVEDLKSEPKATITMKPTPLDKLAGPLGMFLPLGGIQLSGAADMRYAGKKKAPIVGHVDATLTGFSVPLPKEAQGFVFGDTTQLSTDVEIGPDRRTVTLKKTKVTHGEFTLEGQGTITRGKGGATIDLDLVGKISCQALAKAAIKGGVGDRLGGLAERLASGAVTGSVEVKLHIQADTGSLLSTKIDRSLGIGCGISWPSMPDIPEIPKIPGLPELPALPF
jgi:ADP-dependent NAD(P)H-hydrate dehydratase / NAD(P)H-hydrate epimerase